MQPALLGKIVLREFPEIAADIKERYPDRESLTLLDMRIIISCVCYQYNVTPEYITANSTKDKKHRSEIRKLIIGISIALYTPEMFNGTKKIANLANYGNCSIIAESLRRNKSTICQHINDVVLYYKVYPEFKESVLTFAKSISNG